MPTIKNTLALLMMVGVATVGILVEARAQENLDRNLTGPKLFASSCATCHKSARGLAKGRVSFMLTYYLRQHYTSSTGSAKVLSAYLQSVDTPPAKTKRAAGKAKPKGVAASAPTSRLPTGSIPADRPVRPPAKVQKP